jgi:hypothetical protein
VTDTQDSISIIEVMRDRACASDETWDDIEDLCTEMIFAGADIATSRGLCAPSLLRALADYLEVNEIKASMH